MVKTIKGLLSLKEFKQLLTDYARTAPEYFRVDTPEAEIIFYGDYIRLYLKQIEACPKCSGTGIYATQTCDRCEGSGKIYWRNISAKISEYEEYPHYGMLKIEVDTQGSNPELWKPDVEKVRAFIEKLAGKRCIIIPDHSNRNPPTIRKVVPIANITKTLRDYLGGN